MTVTWLKKLMISHKTVDEISFGDFDLTKCNFVTNSLNRDIHFTGRYTYMHNTIALLVNKQNFKN